MRSPRQITFTEAGLAALRAIKQDGESQSKAVERALLIAEGKISATVPVQSKHLDTESYVLLQAERAELENQHRVIKKDILKIRPGDRDSAIKNAAAITKTEKEIEELVKLRLRISNMAQLAGGLTAEEEEHIKTLIGWAKKRITNPNTTPEQKPVYELEYRLLLLLLP